MKYTPTQIKAARENARTHGFIAYVTDEKAIAFLNWYNENKIEINSELDAITLGLTGNLPNGSNKQKEYWSTHLMF